MALTRPLFLCDNLASVVHYPAHVVTAEEEPVGQEAGRFATMRRSDHASATTANSDWWWKITSPQIRAFDTVCLWDHNLLGEALRIQVSGDDYGTPGETIFDATLPSNPGTGHVDDALGVVTEDGMWLKRFPMRYGVYPRLYVPAMGADLKPEISGLIGPSYSPNQYDYPWSPAATELLVEEQTSPYGVIGRGDLVSRRRGEITVKCRSDFDYELARFHLEHRWGKGSPMLIVHDVNQAERAVLAVRVGGSLLDFRTDQSWPDGGEGRVMGTLQWMEWDPK